MRKPRDIDAELKALAEKAKGLKAKRILQLGELVTLTGADALDHATLAGALLQAVAEKDASAKEGWKRAGEALFSRPRPHPEGPRRQVCWKGWRRRCRVFVGRRRRCGGLNPSRRGLTREPGSCSDANAPAT